jgi:hypothetical protein
MIDNSKGACQPHPDDVALQRRFWEIFPTDALDAYQGRPLHGEIRARYPRPQPRRHRSTPYGLAHPDDPWLQYSPGWVFETDRLNSTHTLIRLFSEVLFQRS